MDKFLFAPLSLSDPTVGDGSSQLNRDGSSQLQSQLLSSSSSSSLVKVDVDNTLVVDDDNTLVINDDLAAAILAVQKSCRSTVGVSKEVVALMLGLLGIPVLPNQIGPYIQLCMHSVASATIAILKLPSMEYLKKLFSSRSEKDEAVLILLAKDCEYARDSITFAQEQHVQHMITMLVALLSRRAKILEKEELEKGLDISSSK